MVEQGLFHVKNTVEFAHALAFQAALEGRNVAILDARDAFRPHLFPKESHVSWHAKEKARRRLRICRVFTPEQLKAAMGSLEALCPDLACVFGPEYPIRGLLGCFEAFSFPVVVFWKNGWTLNRAFKEALHGKKRPTPQPSDRQGRSSLEGLFEGAPKGG